MIEDDLIFAKTSVCPCGALLAYKKNADPNNNEENFWDCSDILLGKAIPSGELGAKEHTDQLPFRFWKIK